MKYLKCIIAYYGLTIDKIYECNEEHDWYYILNDKNEFFGYVKSRFIVYDFRKEKIKKLINEL